MREADTVGMFSAAIIVHPPDTVSLTPIVLSVSTSIEYTTQGDGRGTTSGQKRLASLGSNGVPAQHTHCVLDLSREDAVRQCHSANPRKIIGNVVE